LLVHLIHLVNAYWEPGGRKPSDQAKRLGRKSAVDCYTVHTHHRHLSLLVSSKADTVLSTHFTARRWVCVGSAVCSAHVQDCHGTWPFSNQWSLSLLRETDHSTNLWTGDGGGKRFLWVYT